MQSVRRAAARALAAAQPPPAGQALASQRRPAAAGAPPQRKWHDVVIVGGGVVGLSTAYWLRRMEPSCSVCVVERDPTYARAASSLAAGGLRLQFSNAENVALSAASLAFLRAADEHLGEGAAEQLCFREHGYLLLAGTEGGRETLAGNAALQHSLGVGAATRVLAPEELAERWPWMQLDGLTAGSYGERGEGWLDPATLLRLLRRRCGELGCDIVTAEACGVEMRGARAQGGSASRLQLSDGRALPLGHLVNAAGPAAGIAAEWLGAAAGVPVAPRKRYTYLIQAEVPGLADGLPMPLTVDPTGVWIRPEGRGFICGVSPPEEEDPEVQADDFDVREDAERRWEEVIWPALAERIAGMEACRVVTQWAGHYDYNREDQNGIVGTLPSCPNAVHACGFSGHGLQQSPAVGRAAAELILHGRFLTLDLEAMSPARFAAGRLLVEKNVV